MLTSIGGYISKNCEVILLSVASSLLAALLFAGICWLWRKIHRKPPLPQGDEIYSVVKPSELKKMIPQAGTIVPDYVPHPEVADIDGRTTDFILISGDAATGKTFEAWQLILRLADIPDEGPLKVLVPTTKIAPLQCAPAGGGGDVVVFIDDINDQAEKRNNLAQVLAEMRDQFHSEWFQGHYFYIVATIRSEYVDDIRPNLCSKFKRLRHIAITPFAGEAKRRFLLSLADAFGLELVSPVIDALVATEKWTTVAAYDVFQARKNNGDKALLPEDAQRLEDYTHRREWYGALHRPAQRVVDLLSILQGCGVPLRQSFVELVAQQQDSEATTPTRRLAKWRGRIALRHAMYRLSKTYIPRTKDGIFTPHDSRLDLDRKDLIADACLIARTLVPMCDDRPAPRVSAMLTAPLKPFSTMPNATIY